MNDHSDSQAGIVVRRVCADRRPARRSVRALMLSSGRREAEQPPIHGRYYHRRNIHALVSHSITLAHLMGAEKDPNSVY